MPATANTPQPPTRPPPAVGPDGRAPPGWRWAVMYRRRRRDPWHELFRGATAEEVWTLMCDARQSGEFHPRLVPIDLFDPAEG